MDQATKALVTGALQPGESRPIIDDLLRIVFSQNSGALFGLFKDNAAMFGVVSLGVIGLIVAYHGRSAARNSRRIATLIAASATLKVYQRTVPSPPSTKSTT